MDDRVRRLVSEIDQVCRRLADPRRVAKYARYFREGFDAYGVNHEDPLWAEKRQAWLAANQDLGLNGYLKLGRALFAAGKFEHGALAVWFVAQFRDRIGARAFAGIGRWFEDGVRNWAHSDGICGELLSPRLASGAVRLQALASWRKSPHRFKRRAVPVAMLGLLKTGADCRPLLAFLRPLMLDPERVVQQGLGWFLREAWKREPGPVEAFLLEWKEIAPRLIFQYATERMSAAARERFRRSKAAGAGRAPRRP